MDAGVELTVGEVARVAGVTVRTLHHYDEVGLLHPSGRTAAGYRLYGQADLDRLQRILGYRALGFGLDEIADLVDKDGGDSLEDLARQQQAIRRRIEVLEDMAATLDKTMEARAMGISLTPQEMLEVFGDHDPTVHADEVVERWGGTDAYAQSRRRTSGYTKADWLAMKEEAAGVEAELVASMTSGASPDSDRARAAAEAHRRHISAWFYDCTYDIHVGLADMYVADPRFTAHYEELAPGLAAYVREAIHANAAAR